jgi:hypothetical protein
MSRQRGRMIPQAKGITIAPSKTTQRVAAHVHHRALQGKPPRCTHTTTTTTHTPPQSACPLSRPLHMHMPCRPQHPTNCRETWWLALIWVDPETSAGKPTITSSLLLPPPQPPRHSRGLQLLLLHVEARRRPRARFFARSPSPTPARSTATPHPLRVIVCCVRTKPIP